jgi:hypothetical protein
VVPFFPQRWHWWPSRSRTFRLHAASFVSRARVRADFTHGVRFIWLLPRLIWLRFIAATARNNMTGHTAQYIAARLFSVCDRKPALANGYLDRKPDKTRE